MFRASFQETAKRFFIGLRLEFFNYFDDSLFGKRLSFDRKRTLCENKKTMLCDEKRTFKLADRVIDGGTLDYPEALFLFRRAPREAFHEAAHRITAARASKRFDLCSILGVRSGACSEDCKWCAQSVHFKTGVPCFRWVGAEACVAAAKASEAAGIGHLGLVTSGRGQSAAAVDELVEALKAIHAGTRVHVCGSLGLLSEKDLIRLKEAGLERVHCNLETAPSAFGRYCSTHTIEDKIKTLLDARRVGLPFCSGGIIGIGESDEEIIEFAFALAKIGSLSIPLNILQPIPGTPLEHQPPLAENRVLDIIALMRFINPVSRLRFAGGRTRLSDETARRAVYIGINAGIMGPMLTTPGPKAVTDRALALEAGYDVSQPLRPAP